MLRSGQPLNHQWRTVNRQGARGGFHNGEIISARDAIENRRPRILLGGAPGWSWASPIELPDPADNSLPGYGQGQAMHIQSSNSIVSAGVTDLGSGLITMSIAGLWVAIQAVPASQTIDDVLQWNVPQLPLPNPDNYDDPLNFWAYLGEAICY